MKIAELFTREKHNDGVWVDVKNNKDAIVGRIRVRGTDSDAYRAAHDGYNQAMVRLASVVRAGGAGAKLLPATQQEKDAAQLAERVALVAEWTFEDDCTEKAVTQLLREAPWISDQVYAIATDSERFLGSTLKTSSDGQSTTSNSESPPQQDPTKA